MVGSKWNSEKIWSTQKESPAQVFSCALSEILQNNFFKEHVWTTASDLGKYLKMLAIIIAFAEYIWIFGICKTVSKAYCLGKIFPWKICSSYYVSIHG